MATSSRGSGAKSQAEKKAALKKESKARKEYVDKETMKGSAFGIMSGDNSKLAIRKAAAVRAKQAGGDGRIGSTPKRVTPRKSTKAAPKKGRNK